MYGPCKRIKPRNSWVNGNPLAPDGCDDHCRAWGGTHKAPTPKQVLAEAYRNNGRAINPDKLTTQADNVCRSLAYDQDGKFQRDDYEEHEGYSGHPVEMQANYR